MIEREHIENSMSFSQNYDRCVSEADFKVSMALEDPSGRSNILGAEGLQSVRAFGNLAQQSLLRGATDPRRE